MPLTVPQSAFRRMISSAEHKILLQNTKLLVQSVAAGCWVALYGHALISLASFFFDKENLVSRGVTRLIFGVLFPGAFMAIIYTGSELFTGNTVTMVLLVLHCGSSKLLHLLRVWGISLAGNTIGAILFAFLVSYLSQDMTQGTVQYTYLSSLLDEKINRKFYSTVALGFACNSLVCLATWCCSCLEGAGKILAIFYSISIFAVGGYEHVIANIYYAAAAIFVGYGRFGRICLYILLPSGIGNIIAGTLFTGTVWWYAHHPTKTSLQSFTNTELLHEISKRHTVGSMRVIEENKSKDNINKNYCPAESIKTFQENDFPI